MKYRSEIDGLRALAVIGVILFHAGFESFSGGFVGVDVFFVISGYLITRLISDEIARGEFSLARFYERRARRILPALFLVCLVCVPVAWRLLLPEEFSEFGLSIVAVAAFISNIYFWTMGDYFAAPAETSALHHTWSLAVEEQFYVLFPLLLLQLARQGNQRVVSLLLIGSFASLVLAEVGSRIYPSASFYLIPTRAWELGVGAIAALGHRPSTFGSDTLKSWLSVAGLAAILLPMAFFDASTRHPGLITLVPVLGTVTLIACATPQTIVGRWLASRPVVAIGLVSYSAYLWHQPLFAFARVYFGTPSRWQLMVLTGLTLALAGLSWRFVERPFRDGLRVPRKTVLRFSVAGGTALLTTGMLAHTIELDPGRLDAERQFVAHWARDRSPTYRKCIFRFGDQRDLKDACIHGISGSPKVALLGDSHAGAIAGQLAAELVGSDRALIELTRVTCPPAPGLNIATEKGKGCAEFNAAVAERLKLADIDAVIMVARWSQYLHSTPYDNGDGVITSWTAPASPIDANGSVLDEESRIQEVRRLYVEGVTRLLREGKRVVLVYPLPEIGWETPREMVRRERVAIGQPAVVSVSHGVFVERNSLVYAAFDGIPAAPNLLRVVPEALFCNSVVPRRCVAEIGGEPLFWDDSHLNHTVGAKLLAAQIGVAMAKRGWK